jgi:hypothetical protein
MHFARSRESNLASAGRATGAATTHNTSEARLQKRKSRTKLSQLEYSDLSGLSLLDLRADSQYRINSGEHPVPTVHGDKEPLGCRQQSENTQGMLEESPRRRKPARSNSFMAPDVLTAILKVGSL